MTPSSAAPPGRNEPCYCGSGKKYKHCCLPKDEAKQAKARAKAAKVAEEAADQPAEAAAAPAPARAPKTETHQPWRATTSRGFVPRTRSPRKVGGS